MNSKQLRKHIALHISNPKIQWTKSDERQHRRIVWKTRWFKLLKLLKTLFR